MILVGACWLMLMVVWWAVRHVAVGCCYVWGRLTRDA